MAGRTSPEKREISTFGPIFVNNNCIELPVAYKDHEYGGSYPLNKDGNAHYESKTTQTVKHHRSLSPKSFFDHIGRGMALVRHDKHGKRNQATESTIKTFQNDSNEIEYVLKRLEKDTEKVSDKGTNVTPPNDKKSDEKVSDLNYPTLKVDDKVKTIPSANTDASKTHKVFDHETEINQYIDETTDCKDATNYDDTVKSGYGFRGNELLNNYASSTPIEQPLSTDTRSGLQNVSAKNQDDEVTHTNKNVKKTQQDKKEYFATESRAALRRWVRPKSSGLHRRYASDGMLERKNLNSLFDGPKRWSYGQQLEDDFGNIAVVAIDFGTTYSGYAYCFTNDPDNIYMMRKTDGGDPGVFNQKEPTSILLTPEGNFHSFGFAARDFYHDLDKKDAAKWMFFERFKMLLHLDESLTRVTKLVSETGRESEALKIFSYGLAYFKDHALAELSEQTGMRVTSDIIKWVVTVPAIWKPAAKQFMRQAAYNAGIESKDNADQLLIALEPEAASIYCRRLRLLYLAPYLDAGDSDLRNCRPSSPHELSQNVHGDAFIPNDIDIGTRYMIVDCGGGTTDITVHQTDIGGRLKEIHKPSGGPYGSIGVDKEFELLLCAIFGNDTVESFKSRRPAGWVDLMTAFEARKRSAGPYRSTSVTISFPFSFIDFIKKTKGNSIESAVKKYGDEDISWTSSGMLRLSPAVMRRLFLPTVNRIKQEIGNVLNHPNNRRLSYLFLIGGFAESSMLQHELRQDFGHILRIIIPQGVGTITVKGAVLFGLDPQIICERRSMLTYGVGVLRRFKPDKHPESKKVVKDGIDWCTDILDEFVLVDQTVALGDTVVRSYTPVRRDQTSTVINIYSADRKDVLFITDKGVRLCGTLCLDLVNNTYDQISDRNGKRNAIHERREIRASMQFGDTEIKVTAFDTRTNRSVNASIDFLNA